MTEDFEWSPVGGGRYVLWPSSEPIPQADEDEVARWFQQIESRLPDRRDRLNTIAVDAYREWPIERLVRFRCLPCRAHKRDLAELRRTSRGLLFVSYRNIVSTAAARRAEIEVARAAGERPPFFERAVTLVLLKCPLADQWSRPHVTCPKHGELAIDIAQLHEVLGPDARRIEHIGSTATPLMDAKNILDVQVSVADAIRW